MAIISGVFTDPFGVPMANVTLILTARATASASFAGTNAAAVTAADGSYSMSVLTGLYAVSATINRQPDYLGIIQVYPDSDDGTLNQFLNNFDPDDVTPDVIAEMVVLVAAAVEAAKSAESSAETAAKYAVVPRGEYDSATSYAANDIVEFKGSEYRATTAVVGISPPAAPWELFLAAGADGDNGPANTLAVGTVETLPAGSAATATITGEAPNQTLNLAIPQGKEGNPGDPGDPGDPGPANTLTIGTVETLPAGSQATATITGDAPNQTLSLALPQGPDGGDGPANTLTIGEVTTLAPGEPATATITGEAPNQTLDLGIPQGEQGEAGGSGSIPTLYAPGSPLLGYTLQYANAGDSIAGSDLWPGGIGVYNSSNTLSPLVSPGGDPVSVGTWTAFGYANPQGKETITLFIRTDSVSSSYKDSLVDIVRNPGYANAAGTLINCDILIDGVWKPFTASPADVAWWGAAIYAAAAAGELGDVAKYSE